MSLPVAYAIKRKNKKACGGMAKMAKGGMVDSEDAFNDSADYEMDREDNDMNGSMIAKSIMAKKYAKGGEVDSMDSDEDLFPLGESELHETPGHLMEDGEHEVEGMGEKEALMKKGLMARILGSVRLKNMGM